MKKVLKITLIFVIMLLCSVSVAKATTNDDLYNYLSQNFNVSGKSYKLEDEYLTKVKRYLNEYTVTEEQSNAVKSKVQETINIMEEEKVSDYRQLSDAKKSAIRNNVVAAGNAVGAKIVFSSNPAGKETIDVYAPDGKLFDSVQVTNNDELVQTGSDYSFIVYTIAGVAVVAVAAVVIYKKNKVNA